MTDNDKPAFACTCEAPCWKQVKDILEEEANRLAMVLDNGRTDAALKDAGFPHRVEIAVHREIKRLRDLAAWAESVSNAGLHGAPGASTTKED